MLEVLLRYQKLSGKSGPSKNLRSNPIIMCPLYIYLKIIILKKIIIYNKIKMKLKIINIIAIKIIIKKREREININIIIIITTNNK